MNKKKKKLNLDELSVQSFVTSLEVESGQTNELKGGNDPTHTFHTCETGVCPCPAPCDRITTSSK